MIINACDTIGDGDGGEAGTVTEGMISNACDTIGDGYGGEAGTVMAPLPMLVTAYVLPL